MTGAGRADAGRGGWRRHLAAAALVAVAVGLYLPTLGHGFVWDDHDFIEDNPAVRAPGLLARVPALFGLGFASTPFAATPGPYYRPLVVLSFALDGRLGGGRPFVFHLTNLLLNAAAVLLVHRVLRRLGCDERWAFLGALLFAVHPSHVESVAWTVGRTDVLATVGFLAAWLAFLAAAPPAVAIGAFAAAVLAKEVALVLPLQVLPEVRRGGRRARWVLGALLVVVGLYVAARTHALAAVAPAADAGGLAGRLARAPLVFGRALATLVWPWSPCPVHDLTRPTAPVLAGLAALAGPAVAALASAGARRRLRPLGRPALLFALTLLPVSGIVPLPVPFAERFLYLPSVAFVWALAVLGQGLAPRFRRAAVIAAGLLALAGAARTVTYAPVWHDDVALFTRILSRWPQSVPALNELGVAWTVRGDAARARPPLERAVQLEPAFAPARFNLARVLEAQGDIDGAVAQLRVVLRLEPRATGVPRHLVRLLAGAGRAGEAAPDLERAAAAGSAEAAALLRDLRAGGGAAAAPAPVKP